MPSRILVIEDNVANLELMVYLLEAFGHTTVSARDGEEGIEAALREAPDAILCDIQLPKADGYKVATRLRADPRTCSTPRIAVTAFAMVGDRDKLLGAGFNGYIGKPINPQTFVPEVDTFLPAGRGSRQPAILHEEAAEIPRAPGERQGTILLVDNTPANLEFGRAILEPRGFHTIAVGTVADAVESAHREVPDLIISDIDMPDRGGYELLRLMKASPDLHSIPFVLISATSPMFQSESRARSEQLGCARFLVRPIPPEEFLAVVEQLLNRPAAPAGA